jgi:hypothetical protein
LGGGAPERFDRLDHFRRKLAQHHRRDLSKPQRRWSDRNSPDRPKLRRRASTYSQYRQQAPRHRLCAFPGPALSISYRFQAGAAARCRRTGSGLTGRHHSRALILLSFAFTSLPLAGNASSERCPCHGPPELQHAAQRREPEGQRPAIDRLWCRMCVFVRFLGAHQGARAELGPAACHGDDPAGTESDSAAQPDACVHWLALNRRRRIACRGRCGF